MTHLDAGIYAFDWVHAIFDHNTRRHVYIILDLVMYLIQTLTQDTLKI